MNGATCAKVYRNKFPHTPASVGPQLKVCGGGVNDALCQQSQKLGRKIAYRAEESENKLKSTYYL